MGDTRFVGVVVSPASDLTPTPNDLDVQIHQANAGGSLVTGQDLAIGASSTVIVPARPGFPGTGRKLLNVTNTGSVTVFLGPPGVTISTGIKLIASASRQLDTQSSVCGVVASGTGAVDFDEIY